MSTKGQFTEVCNRCGHHQGRLNSTALSQIVYAVRNGDVQLHDVLVMLGVDGCQQAGGRFAHLLIGLFLGGWLGFLVGEWVR